MARLTSWLVTMALVSGCGDDQTPDSEDVGEDTGSVDEVCEASGEELTFFRTTWEAVGTYPFPHIGPDGTMQISSIKVGGREIESNFANRGDVFVEYSGPEDTISIEMRKFVLTDGLDHALESFDKTALWAYAGLSDPKPPHEIGNTADNCLDAWQDGCELRVYYDGSIQPSRLGADLRITLPGSYRGALDLFAGDLIGDDDLILRGEVRIDGLPGEADVTLGSGTAEIIVADDASPAPTCSAADLQACDTDPNGAWDLECPCRDFGTLKAATGGGDSANIVVDVPGDLWTTVSLENKGPGQSLDAEHCVAHLEPTGIPMIDVLAYDPQMPWKGRFELNHPSDAALVGGGFNIRLESDQCEAVYHVPDPNGCPEPEPVFERRGNLTVCAGCLRE